MRSVSLLLIRFILVLLLASAAFRVTTHDGTQFRRVKSGSSYLSQSELALTFGLGKRVSASRVVIEWPSGAVQDFTAINAGAYQCTEGSRLVRDPGV